MRLASKVRATMDYELIKLYYDYKRELRNTDSNLMHYAEQDIAVITEREDMGLIKIQEPDYPLAGFMVYSLGKCNVIGLKSKPVDYFIEELYIKPQLRRQGLASGAVKRFLAEHKGTYGIYILDYNAAGKAFWFSLIKPSSFARADSLGKFYYWRQK